MSYHNNIYKRKRIESVTLNDKLLALKELKNGVSISTVAHNLKVTCKTVRNWQRYEEKLSKWEDQHRGNMTQQKKRMRSVSNDFVDKATWIWFSEKRAAGVPPPGTYIQLQAKSFHTMLEGNGNFEASNGWLQRWQQRHNVRSLTMCSDKPSTDKDTIEAYKAEIKNYIETEELLLDQIFICERMSINYKMIPETNQVVESEDESVSIEREAERVTVVVCSNVSGSLKLPIIVVGKDSKLRGKRNLSSQPVYYKSQKSAWMSAPIVEAWFGIEFVPKVTKFLHAKGLPNKAVLFMDNCATRLNTLTRNNINIRFFPPNTISLIQSVEHSCLQTLKMHFRRSMMTHIIDAVNRGETLRQCLKDLSVRDVIPWFTQAWERVTMTAIRKSWNSLLPSADYGAVDYPNAKTNITNQSLKIEDNEDDLLACLLYQFHEAIQRSDEYKDIEFGHVSLWFNSSITLQPEDCLSDQEIVDIVSGKEQVDRENSNHEDKEIPPVTVGPKASISDAQNAVNTLITYCEENNMPKKILLTLSSLKENLKTKEQKLRKNDES